MKKLTILLTILVVALVATGCPQPNTLDKVKEEVKQAEEVAKDTTTTEPNNETTEPTVEPKPSEPTPSVPLHEQGFDLETYDVSLKFDTPKLYKITLKGKLLDYYNKYNKYPEFTFTEYDSKMIYSVEADGSDENKMLRIRTSDTLGTTTIKMSAKDEEGNVYYRNIKVTVTLE